MEQLKIGDYEKMIGQWQSIITNHLTSIIGYLDSNSQVSTLYIQSKQRMQPESFNVFQLISNTYYRENFHSDILRLFLDPRENHKEGNKFLFIFLEMIKKAGKPIEVEAYEDAEVVREEGRIDVLIKTSDGKNAIIVENKMNNAGDMPRQLPRYYDYLHERGYNVDAIVYLPLEKSKTPDTYNWSDTDKTNVNSLLTIIPAYDKTGGVNLYDSWVLPATKVATTEDVRSTLNQYAHLISILNTNYMDTAIFKAFYENLLQGNNMEIAQSVRNMMSELPDYMAIRIQEMFKNSCSPFSKVWRYKGNDTVFEGAVVKGVYLKLDIVCSENGYEVLFWTPNENKQQLFENLILTMQSVREFKQKEDGGQIEQHFKFMEEERLVDFIHELLSELSSKREK